MKNVLILENNTSPLQDINESKSNNKNEYVLGGSFTEFGVKNRNERIYTWSKFKPALEELNHRIEKMGVYGEFDHPDTFDTSLKNASHMVQETYFDNSKNNVSGKIKLLSTRWGEEAKKLHDEGAPLFVSSRAAGITESNGEVSIKKLFTYDVVADPGFETSKMESLNESYGFSSNAHFQIFEMKDESKINKLFNMNKNDYVTKNQISEYSDYLVKEISSTKRKIDEAVKTGKVEPKKIEELLEYYENMQEDQQKITKYLDYLAENLQMVVSENKSLKKANSKLENKTNKLIGHNDYLAEQIENSISYSNYIAENLDKSIQYGDYIGKKLDESINYSNYIAENLDKSINYEKYLAENLDNVIQYGDYIAENLNGSIKYSNYLREQLNSSIKFSDYIAENVDSNIAYSKYIAEQLDDGLAYTDYLGEQLDKSIGYSKMISEALNSGNNINESSHQSTAPMPEEAGLSNLSSLDKDMEFEFSDGKLSSIIDSMIERDEKAISQGKEKLKDLEKNQDHQYEFENPIDKGIKEEEPREGKEGKSNLSNISSQIDNLIEEAKKREASKADNHHFLKFLNKKQIDSFYSLTESDQEEVVAHINEKGNYYSSSDVLRLMNEALSKNEEKLEEKLVRLMPEDVKGNWEKISETAQNSILSQARLHPSSNWNEDTIEHFWYTRKFPSINENKKLVDKEDKLVQEDKLSDQAFEGILEKMSKLS